jgi:hypothetical protein
MIRESRIFDDVQYVGQASADLHENDCSRLADASGRQSVVCSSGYQRNGRASFSHRKDESEAAALKEVIPGTETTLRRARVSESP